MLCSPRSWRWDRFRRKPRRPRIPGQQRTHFAIASGKLASITDRAGKDWAFSSCAPENGGVKAICLTDPEGKTQRWSSNDASNPVAVSDAGDLDVNGDPRTKTRFEYHQALSNPVRTGLLAKVIDANLHETSYGDPAAADRGT